MAVTEVKSIHSVFVEAFNRGDVEGLVALYEPNAVFTPQPGVLIQGLDAIRPAIEGFVKTGLKMTMSTTYILENGDLALLSGEWQLSAGGQVAMSGKSSEVVRRGADGGWRYVLDNPSSS